MAPVYRWHRITENAAFAPRDGAGALTFKGKMWLLGGWNPDDKVHFPNICNSEVWSSSDGETWKLELLRAPWDGRHCAGYAVFKDRLWIVGGDGNQGYIQRDVWSSADGIHWDQVCDNVPWAPRCVHYTVVHRGKIWVMGGQTIPPFSPDLECFYGDVWCSGNGKDWTKIHDNAPWAPRGLIGGSAVFQDKIWVMGGGTYNTPARPDRIFYNDVWNSADGVRWNSVTPGAPWHPREYHDVAVFDGRLWVFEGYHKAGGNRKDVWHSADGVTWHEVPNTPWLPRHAASVFVHDNALWMVAGNNMTPDAWKLAREA